jgi:disulfide bond formation protein DsbB
VLQTSRTVRAQRSRDRARLLALLVPGVLLAGALGSQYLGGLYPCEMCHWQRWPHYAALAPAALAFVTKGGTRTALVALAALLVAASGLIGVFHAGVEYGWWEGITSCTSTVATGGATAEERLRAILDAPLIRCDRPPWSLGGVSLAGFNALFSLGGALTIWALLRRRAR